MHRKVIASLLIVALVLVSGFASAAVSLFMKADDIKGDSVDAQFRGQIEIQQMQFGAKDPVASSGGAGKAQFEDLTITKNVDRSSPVLAAMVANGKVIRQVVISVKSQAGVVEEFTLNNVIVSGYAFSAGGANAGVENITLHFQQIKMAYTPTNATGGKDPAVTMGWDVVSNRAM
jgi:type VI secretion system secreted protein Hcp